MWLVSVFMEVSLPRTCGKQVSVFVVNMRFCGWYVFLLLVSLPNDSNGTKETGKRVVGGMFRKRYKRSMLTRGIPTDPRRLWGL